MNIEHALLVGMGALVSAIVHIYLRNERQQVSVNERLADCERDRLQLWAEIAKLNREVCILSPACVRIQKQMLNPPPPSTPPTNDQH